MTTTADKLQHEPIIYDATGPALVMGIVEQYIVARRPRCPAFLLPLCEIDSLHYTQWTTTKPEKKA